MFETWKHQRTRSLIFLACFWLSSTSSLTRYEANANSPSPEKKEAESVSLDNPFPESPRDQGVPNVRSFVKEATSNGQFMIGVGFKEGLREGYFLNIVRGPKAIGVAEVVEVLEESCRCLTELSLEAGDEVVLASLMHVHGRCLNMNNRPIEGVTIALFRSHMNHSHIDKPTIVALTKTTEDGSFQLPVCEAIQLVSSRTDLFLVARKEGYVSTTERLNRGQEELSMRMDDSKVASLVGIVLGPNGELISGAEVRLNGLNTRIDGLWCTQTDEKGKYLLTDLAEWSPNVPHNTTRSLIVSHPEYGQSTVPYTQTPSMVNVRLKVPAMVQGKVVDQVTGEPVRHAIVTAQGVHEKGWFQTRTDNDGRYELRMPPDKYNIWSEMNGRVPIAVNSIEAVAGEKQSEADIQMVRGSVVYGKFLTEQNTPIKPETRTLVAHHGPARPISGAAVTSTPIASDGSYRLHVAPGKNYVYVMAEGSNASANIEIADGTELELNLRLGNHPANQRPAANAIRKLPEHPKEPFIPSRVRGNTAVAALLNKLEEQNANSERYTDAWLQTLKDLADLGKEAVPELCEELDATESDRMMRCMGFTLRAIGDPRAVPTLIRAIPKTLMKPSSDMGLRLPQGELSKFALANEISERDDNTFYLVARPVREIFGAIHRLTKVKLADEHLFHIFSEGTDRQRSLKATLFHRQAERWADWWEKHAEEFDVPLNYKTVKLSKPPARIDLKALVAHAQYKTVNGSSNWLMESADDPTASTVFFDIDTGRVAKLPQKWRDKLPGPLPMNEIAPWAADEGFDIMGIQVPTVDGEPVYALRNLDMQAWELDEKRWKMKVDHITLEELRSEGREVGEYLFHEGPQGLDRQSKASFLIITREGTPMLLHVGIPVLDDSLKPGGISTGDDELRPIAFRKGRRFAFDYLECSD
jgi:Carboxypeptidase regulatory-like domain